MELMDTKLKEILFYLKIWVLMSKNAFLLMLNQKKLLFLFLLGKLLRFTFFIVFLIYLVKGTNGLAGFSSNQIVFFFLTFNLVDIISQFLFREVYRFRPLLISGDFDLILIKPVNPLFRILLGGADVIDLITIPPLIIALIYLGSTFHPETGNIIFYLLLLINALLITTAFHITILGLGIITLVIDNIMWIYRDITNLGRLPVDIYRQPLKSILTFLIPIGIMFTLPVKALIGLVTFQNLILSLFLGLGLIFLSIKFWQYSLKHYTGASS
ncbi:hypothetical protein A2Z22_02070 [Candidatus Woesebacteria bacterium RBG_16_34_12]|uniref:ABC transporter permease n=1 Tax=Candidatus Woesebacteria bacterium RBG_16_34_12 TaxID=1802480 RepID=A0A1F7X973_9BACT|nr:MAG: hypothetical protein A2Z22_02070 [Candidatus Woesebacteria bacterium RBG_16_34_12]